VVVVVLDFSFAGADTWAKLQKLIPRTATMARMNFFMIVGFNVNNYHTSLISINKPALFFGTVNMALTGVTT
jgi:hypothetical protein